MLSSELDEELSLLEEEVPSPEELLREKSLWLEEALLEDELLEELVEEGKEIDPQEARTNADNNRKTLVTFFISYLLDDKNRQLSIRILCPPAPQKCH